MSLFTKHSTNKHALSTSFTLIATLCFSIFAQAASLEAAQNLTLLLKAQKNFQSDYQQSIYQANGELYEKSEGKLFLGDNKQFRNDKLLPESTSVISNGKKLWIIDHDLEQVSITQLDEHLKSSPLALLLDNTENALEHFEVQNQNQQSFSLKQKDAYSAFPNIQMTFKNLQILSIEIDEASGKKIRIDFKDISKLKDKNIFKANFPDTYDVVDESN